MLHGTEAVVPLPDGRSIPVHFDMPKHSGGTDDLLAEIRALRRENVELLTEIRNTAGDQNLTAKRTHTIFDLVTLCGTAIRTE
jgi:hypothetical protein